MKSQKNNLYKLLNIKNKNINKILTFNIKNSHEIPKNKMMKNNKKMEDMNKVKSLNKKSLEKKK